MKKFFLLSFLLALPFAMQGQSKFHDAEVHEAVGAVKKIESTRMGRPLVVTFTQDGKMQQEGVSDAVYDADGYLQSYKMSAMGQEFTVTIKWENGKYVGQSSEMMGQPFVTTMVFDDKGTVVGTIIKMGDRERKSEYTDIKCDAHGNWISRKTTMMGREVEQTRTIEYYE